MDTTETTLQRWQALWGRHRLAIVFGSVYLMLSLFAMVHFLNSSFLGDRYFKTAYDGMYDGTTHQPFVYRQLVPLSTRLLVAISPESLQVWVNDSVEAFRGNTQYEIWRITMPWLEHSFTSPGRHYQRIITMAIIYASLWGYVWALLSLARNLFPLSAAVAFFAPVFGLLAISSFSYPFQYIYDIPVLFLSTACYYFLAARRWRAYVLCFALACLNKETALFIALFSAIWLWKRLSKRGYINLMVAQYFVYAIIRLALLYAYQDNPGEYLKNHLFRTVPNEMLTLSNYERIFKIAFMFFLLTFQWNKKPAMLKCSLWLVPVMYAMFLLYGLPGEYRMFFDIMPLLLLLGVHTLVDGTGLSKAAFFTPISTPNHTISDRYST